MIPKPLDSGGTLLFKELEGKYATRVFEDQQYCESSNNNNKMNNNNNLK